MRTFFIAALFIATPSFASELCSGAGLKEDVIEFQKFGKSPNVYLATVADGCVTLLQSKLSHLRLSNSPSEQRSLRNELYDLADEAMKVELLVRAVRNEGKSAQSVSLGGYVSNRDLSPPDQIKQVHRVIHELLAAFN